MPRNMKQLLSPEQRTSYLYLVKWALIVIVTGITGALLLQSFRTLLSIGQGALMTIHLPLPVWGIAAALLVGGIIYRIEPEAAGEGMPSYLECLNRYGGDFPAGATFWKYPSALLTLIAFGSGGIAGPLGRVNAGFVSAVMKKLGPKRFNKQDRRTASICGMAAVIGALFHVPIGGGIFAVEIIQKANMRYSDLFPAVFASAVATWVSKQLGWEPLFSVSSPAGIRESRPWH